MKNTVPPPLARMHVSAAPIGSPLGLLDGSTGLHSVKWLRLADINWRHVIMPKGMQRGNREAKKPKKDHSIPRAPVAGEAVVRPPAPVVADRRKRK